MTVTVTERGQVTFQEDLLQHMGIQPGDRLEIDKQPGGTITLRAQKPKGSIENFIGILKGKTDVVATIDEIKKATEDAWAGIGR